MLLQCMSSINLARHMTSIILSHPTTNIMLAQHVRSIKLTQHMTSITFARHMSSTHLAQRIVGIIVTRCTANSFVHHRSLHSGKPPPDSPQTEADKENGSRPREEVKEDREKVKKNLERLVENEEMYANPYSSLENGEKYAILHKSIQNEEMFTNPYSSVEKEKFGSQNRSIENGERLKENAEKYPYYSHSMENGELHKVSNSGTKYDRSELYTADQRSSGNMSGGSSRRISSDNLPEMSELEELNDRAASRITDRHPGLYSLGQKLSGKSASAIGSISEKSAYVIDSLSKSPVVNSFSEKSASVMSSLSEKSATVMSQLTEKSSSAIGSVSEKSASVINQLSEKSATALSAMRDNRSGASNQRPPEDWNDILNRWYQQYLDFVGITDLKLAQNKVTQLSDELMETQARRRVLQRETESLQESLVTNHQRIAKAEQYSQEHFALFDEARRMTSRLKVVKGELAECEATERDTFVQLSAAIRDCHERERTQADHSKYWSIIASLVSAALASIITSVNNWVRIREIKQHVTTTNLSLVEGYTQMRKEILGLVSAASSTPFAVSDPSNSASSTPSTASEPSFTTSSVSSDPTSTQAAATSTSSLPSVPSTASISSSIPSTPSLSSPTTAIIDSVSSTLSTASPSPISSPITTPPSHPTPTTASITTQTDKHRERESLAHTLIWQEISTSLSQEGQKLREEVERKFGGMEEKWEGIRKELEALREGLSVIGEKETPIVNEFSSDYETTTLKEEELSKDFETDTLTVTIEGETVTTQGETVPRVAIEGDKVAIEYSYRHIASAMAIGAGIGTLVTAFIFGSFSGVSPLQLFPFLFAVPRPAGLLKP